MKTELVTTCGVHENVSRTGRLAGALGLSTSKWADQQTVSQFYKAAFDLCDHTRIIDCQRVHRAVCKSLGERAKWVFGYSLTPKTIQSLAEKVNESLVGFVSGVSDMRLFHISHEPLPHLVAAPNGECTVNRITGECALVIPTGLFSETTKAVVHLRVDVVPSSDRYSIFTAIGFLFANELGRSISGFGDIQEYLVHLDGATEAIEEFLGHTYDVLTLNGDIYDAWWRNHVEGGEPCEIVVPLGEFSKEGRPTAVVLTPVPGQRAWTISLKDGEDCIPIEDFIPGLDLAVNPNDAEREWREIVGKFCSPFDVGAALRFDHVIVDHIERYAEEFVQEMIVDPQRAGSRFIPEVERAIARLKANALAWMPAVYNAGQEAELEFAGESIDSALYLLAPLYLTDRAERLGVPTVYLVATLRTNDDGTKSCFFPSVLDSTSSMRNMRNLRRAYRNGIDSCV